MRILLILLSAISLPLVMFAQDDVFTWSTPNGQWVTNRDVADAPHESYLQGFKFRYARDTIFGFGAVDRSPYSLYGEEPRAPYFFDRPPNVGLFNNATDLLQLDEQHWLVLIARRGGELEFIVVNAQNEQIDKYVVSIQENHPLSRERPWHRSEMVINDEKEFFFSAMDVIFSCKFSEDWRIINPSPTNLFPGSCAGVQLYKERGIIARRSGSVIFHEGSISRFDFEKMYDEIRDLQVVEERIFLLINEGTDQYVVEINDAFEELSRQLVPVLARRFWMNETYTIFTNRSKAYLVENDSIIASMDEAVAHLTTGYSGYELALTQGRLIHFPKGDWRQIFELQPVVPNQFSGRSGLYLRHPDNSQYWNGLSILPVVFWGEDEQFSGLAFPLTSMEVFNVYPNPFGAAYPFDFFWNVWRVEKSMVEWVRSDWEDGALDYPLPFEILFYPGAGNTAGRTPDHPISVDYFKFDDVNGNGIYEPLLGDLPDLEGADWVAMNRINRPNENYPGFYEYALYSRFSGRSCDQTGALENQTYQIDYYLDGADTIANDIQLELWIRNGGNEEAETYPADKAFVLFDKQQPSDTSFNIYESFTLLNTRENWTSTTLRHNGARDSFPDWMGLPSLDELRNRTQGLWGDGTPMTANGTGYGTNGPITPYIHHIEPENGFNWNVCDEETLTDLYPNSEMQYYLCYEPINLTPGSSKHYSIILKSSESNTVNCAFNRQQLIEEAKQYQQWLENGDLDADFTINDGAEQILLKDYKPLTLTVNNSPSIPTWNTGATSNEIVVTEPGTYSATVFLASGCAHTKYVEILPDIFAQQPVSVAPNPASNKVIIRVEPELQLTSLDLINSNGQLLQRWQGLQTDFFEVPLHNIHNGLLFLRYQLSNEQTGTQKVLVLR